MKQKTYVAVGSLLVMMILFGVGPGPGRAEIEPRPLTLIYSNNINGEIEPCPT